MPPSKRLYYYRATIRKVYDGDSITDADIDFGFHRIQLHAKLRIMGVDTPEVRHKIKVHGQAGRHVRDKLKEKIEGRTIIICSVDKPDKYGRVLSRLYLDDEDISEWLIGKGYAHRYDGGTKTPFKSAELRKILKS